VNRALDRRPRSLRAAFVSSRLMLIVLGGALLTVGVVASLATENWLWFGVALAAHALISTVVIAAAFSLMSQVEKPAPTTVTALEAEGVADPEHALNDLVEQVSEQEPTSSAANS
jgi:membrane protein implicated in regulation of membrane protease activity